jgi:hypothetical protein
METGIASVTESMEALPFLGSDSVFTDSALEELRKHAPVGCLLSSFSNADQEEDWE